MKLIDNMTKLAKHQQSKTQWMRWWKVASSSSKRQLWHISNRRLFNIIDERTPKSYKFLIEGAREEGRGLLAYLSLRKHAAGGTTFKAAFKLAKKIMDWRQDNGGVSTVEKSLTEYMKQITEYQEICTNEKRDGDKLGEGLLLGAIETGISERAQKGVAYIRAEVQSGRMEQPTLAEYVEQLCQWAERNDHELMKARSALLGKQRQLASAARATANSSAARRGGRGRGRGGHNSSNYGNADSRIRHCFGCGHLYVIPLKGTKSKDTGNENEYGHTVRDCKSARGSGCSRCGGKHRYQECPKPPSHKWCRRCGRNGHTPVECRENAADLNEIKGLIKAEGQHDATANASASIPVASSDSDSDADAGLTEISLKTLEEMKEKATKAGASSFYMKTDKKGKMVYAPKPNRRASGNTFVVKSRAHRATGNAAAASAVTGNRMNGLPDINSNHPDTSYGGEWRMDSGASPSACGKETHVHGARESDQIIETADAGNPMTPAQEAQLGPKGFDQMWGKVLVCDKLSANLLSTAETSDKGAGTIYTDGQALVFDLRNEWFRTHIKEGIRRGIIVPVGSRAPGWIYTLQSVDRLNHFLRKTIRTHGGPIDTSNPTPRFRSNPTADQEIIEQMAKGNKGGAHLIAAKEPRTRSKPMDQLVWTQIDEVRADIEWTRIDAGHDSASSQ